MIEQHLAAAALSPATPAAELARLAQAYPQARALVAANPAAPPELLDWLEALGDPAVTAQLRNRRAPTQPMAALPPHAAAPTEPAAADSTRAQPATHSVRNRLLVALAAVLVVAGAGGTALALRGRPSQPPPTPVSIATTSAPASASAPATSSAPPATAPAPTAEKVAPLAKSPSMRWSVDLTSSLLTNGRRVAAWTSTSSMLVLATTGGNSIELAGISLKDGTTAWTAPMFRKDQIEPKNITVQCASRPSGTSWLCVWLVKESKTRLSARPMFIDATTGDVTNLPEIEAAPGSAMPAVSVGSDGASGFVLAAITRGHLSAYAPDGTQLWQRDVDTSDGGQLTIDPGLMTVATTEATQVIDPATGSVYGSFDAAAGGGTAAIEPFGSTLLLVDNNEDADGTKRLAAVGLDGKTAWTAAKGQSAICSIEGSREEEARSMCRAPGTKAVISRDLSGDGEGSFFVLDAGSGKKLWKLPGIAGNIVAANRTSLLYRSGSSYELYRLTDGKQLGSGMGDFLNDNIVADDANYYIMYKGELRAKSATSGKDRWTVSVAPFASTAGLGQSLLRAGGGLLVTDDVASFTQLQYWK